MGSFNRNFILSPDHQVIKVNNDLRVILSDWQLDTKIFIRNTAIEHYAYLNIDKWTELKKNIDVIDEEFRKRYNFPHVITFNLMEDFQVTLDGWQSDATISIRNSDELVNILLDKNCKNVYVDNDSCISLDFNKWSEFKKKINIFDEEFKKRYDAEDRKTFVITENLKVIIDGYEKETVMFVSNADTMRFAHMDYERWTEFKNKIDLINEEFNKRFNYQYPNL